MDKRKIYIITILIIMALLTGLAAWYSYITKKEASITETQDITIPPPTILPAAPSSTESDVIDSASNNTANSTNSPDNLTKTEAGESNTDNNEIVKPKKWVLNQVYTDPTLQLSTSSKELYYTDAKTGVISSYSPSQETHTTISQETLPNLRGVYTLPDDYLLIIPKDARPYIAKAVDSAVVKQATIYDEILQVALTDTAVFYLTSNDIDGISIKKLLYTKLGESSIKATTLWSSPLSNWQLQSTPNNVYITQKASYNIPGYSYLISTKGSTTTLARDLPGLITNLSPNGKTLLYSTSGKDGVKLYIKDTSTGEVTQLYTPTLASKCAWSNDSIDIYCAIPFNIEYYKNLPDSWFKGLTRFSDSMWRINTKTGSAIELKKFTGLDIVDTQILNDTILFKNKRDQSIWSIIKE